MGKTSAQRIVSLVPSLTELICDLGREEELVGITSFCIHPESAYRSKTRIGGTKTVDLDKVRALSPTLIVANKEENMKGQVEALSQEFDVLITDISGLDSALEAIAEIGEKIDCAKKASALQSEISRAFGELASLREASYTAAKSAPRTLYLIWRDPYMSIGHDTFIHDMLMRCGLENMLAESARYPEIDLMAIAAPELVLLSSEPFPFKQKHIDEISSLWPETSVELVDGEYFSWYGSRMLGAAGYFEKLMGVVR